MGIASGRELFEKTHCDECIAAEDAKRALIAGAESRHLANLDGHARDSAIAELLAQIGANPWEHGHASLDNYDPRESGPRPLGSAREFAAAVKDARKYDPVRGLYLHGDTGPGKTHLAIGVIRWLVEHDYPPQRIVFDHAADLIARIQDTYGKREDSTMDVLDRRINAGLWILDDFGTERASEDVVRHMTLIFTRRAMRPNLVTSNYGPELMEKKRPELMRVLSRIGPKYFRVVEVQGHDRRFD